MSDTRPSASDKTSVLPTVPTGVSSEDQKTTILPVFSAPPSREPVDILHHFAEHALHGHVSLHHHRRQSPAHPAAAAMNPWKTLIVLCLGFFMVLLDTTIVSIAVPRIVDGLHASLDQVLWVLNAYTLVFAILLLPAGRLGDIYGERTLFALGVVLFTVASAICGFAADSNQLIAGRLLQGVGAALMTPQTIAIMVAVFPPERRGAAFGVWGAVAGAAAIVGPALGGVIVTYSNWRVVFFVNVPVGIATLVLMFLFVPNLRRTGKHSLDPIGIVLAGSGLFGVMFGLIEGPRYGWGTIAGPISVAALIVAGTALLAVFLVWENFHRQPLLPLSMFANRNYSLMNWVGAVMEFALLGFFMPLTIYFQSVLGLSARDAGLSISPLPLAAMFLAPVAGILADRFAGGKYILATGLTLFSIGAGWFALIAAVGSATLSLIPPLLVAGVGMGCIFAPLGAMAMHDVSEELAGAASGVINATRLLGAVAGGAVVGAVLQTSLAANLKEQAVARASELPASERATFIAFFNDAGRRGIDVGPGHNQAGDLAAHMSGTDATQITRIANEVFVNGFVGAMRPTIAVAVALVLLAALSSLLIQRPPRSGTESTTNATHAGPPAG